LRRYAKGDDAYRHGLDHFERLYEVAGEAEVPNERTLCVDARMVAGPGSMLFSLALEVFQRGITHDDWFQRQVDRNASWRQVVGSRPCDLGSVARFINSNEAEEEANLVVQVRHRPIFTTKPRESTQTTSLSSVTADFETKEEHLHLANLPNRLAEL
jgi:hypothetical protein